MLQNHVLEASWAVRGASWRPLGASWARLGASWAHVGASSRRLGASWSVFERLERVFRRPGRVQTEIMLPGVQARRSPVPRGSPIIKTEETLRTKPYTEKLHTVQGRSEEPRHAAGRLRARCGSNAQQSCVPATAPRTISERLKVEVWRVEKLRESECMRVSECREQHASEPRHAWAPSGPVRIQRAAELCTRHCA